MKSNPATVASNSEVSERAARRQVRAEYKAGILAEYEKGGRGEQGWLLRREGLARTGRRAPYSSHIDAWRKLSEAGVLVNDHPSKPRLDGNSCSRQLHDDLERDDERDGTTRANTGARDDDAAFIHRYADEA